MVPRYGLRCLILRRTCVAHLTTPDSLDFSHCQEVRFHSGPAPWAARNAPSTLNARHTYSCRIGSETVVAADSEFRSRNDRL